MKKLILLDLDNTLFDSALYRKTLFEKIASYFDLNSADVIAVCQQVYDLMIAEIGLLDPDLFIERIGEALKDFSHTEKLQKLLFDNTFIKDYFHKEVLKELEKLHAFGEIGILSQGEIRLQKAKLSNIDHFLNPEKVHIERNKKEKIEKILKMYSEYEIVFVDDMLGMLREAYMVNPAIKTIWLKRGRYAANQEPFSDFSPSAQAETLADVVDIIGGTY